MQGTCGGGTESGEGLISRLARVAEVDTSPRMTRQSIERSVKIFLVALILTFAWTVYQVFVLVGWL